jgi:hypothetical protein
MKCNGFVRHAYYSSYLCVITHHISFVKTATTIKYACKMYLLSVDLYFQHQQASNPVFF